MNQPRDRRRGHTVARLAVLVAAVWGAVIAWMVFAPRGPAIVALGPGDDDLLPLPAVGAALPGYLEDGTPVFVSQPEPGELVVVGATDHHLGDRLVNFCATAGWFEEPYHGSRYNGWGEWTGGPSPSGLTPYPFEVVDGPAHAGVRVTGGPGTPPDRDAHHQHEQPPRGPSCEPGHGHVADAVAHRPPDAVPLVAPAEVPRDRWGWVRLELGGTVGQPRLCDPGTECDPGHRMQMRVAAAPDEPLPRSRATWLARRDRDGPVQLRWPGRPDDRRPEPLEALDVPETDGRLLAPAHGAARPGFLDDGTPVFVARTADGELYVLDAASPSDAVDLVGFCPQAALLADAAGGRWDLTGGRVGGDGVGGLSSSAFVTYEGWAATVVQALDEPRPRASRSPSIRDADLDADCGDLVRHDPDRVVDLGLTPATAADVPRR